MEGSRPRAGEGRRTKGGSERPGIPNPVGEERGRPSRGPAGEGPCGAADAGPGKCLGTGDRRPSPRPPSGSEVPLPLTSEHRFGPRDHGHHHGLLVILPFLTLERHLEAIQSRGALSSQGHGEAKKGDPIAEDGRTELGAPPVAAASCPGPRRARGPPSSPAASPATGFNASRPRAGRVRSGAPNPAAPFYGGSLSASVRQSRLRARLANHVRTRPPVPPQPQVWARTLCCALSLAGLLRSEAWSLPGSGARSLGDPVGQPHQWLAERCCGAARHLASWLSLD